MSIFDKAKALADAISESDELKRVKETEIKVLIDMEARQIIEEFQQIQADAINAGISYDELAQDKKERLDYLEGQMNDNDIIRNYMEASNELNGILESVNMIISSALQGGDQDACASCSSCADGSCSSGACGSN